ncbi:craniofacial development protein 2-like [Coccinella septempunctata]|uniref:craniofacial development protein 2-like n=1 Tax=Coccinella septempunctata TaxID=41139 RepID=UPI001D087C7A|nr:craniofacial development protein 2-like [Coccinella septempunctata]
MDIIVLSETKKKGIGSEGLREYIHFFSGVGKDQRAKAGVSILIQNKYKNKIRSWEPLSERFIKVTIQLRGRSITILGVYALNDDATVQAKDNFEEALREIIEDIPNSHEIIVAGDLNARVGRQRNSKVVGIHGEEVLNNNGERLINICEEYELKIMNTFFAHKNIHKYTWYQHTRGLKSIIDYLIIKQRSGLVVKDIRVNRC